MRAGTLGALVALAVVVFSTGGAFLTMQIAADDQRAAEDLRRGTLETLHLIDDHRVLVGALERHAQAPDAATAAVLRRSQDRLRARFDAVVALLADADDTAPPLAPVVRDARDTVVALAPAIRALAEQPAVAADPALRDAVAATADRLRRAVDDRLALAGGRSSAGDAGSWLTASLGAMVLAEIVLLLVLVNQTRVARRLAREADRARAAEARSAAYLRDAIESTSEAILITDAEDRVVIANRRYREVYPWSADALVPGASLPALIRSAYGSGKVELAEDGDTALARRLAFLRDPGAPFEQSLADGRTILVSERRMADGGLVSIRTDITRQKQVECALAARLAAIDLASEGIALCDGGGRITYLNGACARLFGEAPADAHLGRPWTDLFTAEEAARLQAAAVPALDAEGRWQGAATGMVDRRRRLDLDVALTRLPDGGLVCVLRDETERRAAAAEREALRDRLHRTQKLEAVGRLAGGIAHDFNNILAAMLGYAELIEEDAPEGSETRAFAGQIQTAGTRARDLIRQILAFSRGGEDAVADVAIAPLVRETAAMLRATLPTSIALDWRDPDPSIMLRADPTQIAQVLMNLAVNARDALPDGRGRITLDCAVVQPDGGRADQMRRRAGRTVDGRSVEIACLDDRTARIWVNALEPGRPYCRLTVTDTGTGIPAEALEHIFDPFYTTKEIGAGSGLGLSAVLGIVGGHGGALTVTTTEGEGTRFEVFLPLGGDEMAVDTDAPAADGGPPRPSRPVLVVDDEPQVLDVTLRRLRRAGIATEGTTDPAEALARLRAAPDGWSVLLADQQMPDMLGSDLAAAARAAAPGLPIVLCSGHLGEGRTAEAVAAVADRVLAKPVDEAALLAALADLAGGVRPDADRAGDDGRPARAAE